MKFLLALVSMSFLAPQLTWAKNYTLKVTEKGFEPSTLQVAKGESVTLKVTRTTNETCAKEIVIPEKKIKANLPLNKVVTVRLGKIEKGELKFSCGAQMLRGKVVAQ